MTTLCSGSQLPTYSTRSSGDSAMPFGPWSSSVSKLSVPSLRQKTPLNGSSLWGSSNMAGSPKGGSVKNSVPSERYTRSLGLLSRLPR